MVHKEILKNLNQDLDDLKVRNPKAYHEIENELKRLEAKANFDVSMSPVGIRDMERGR